MKTEIIFEDTDILICRKPAGLPTQTARIGQADMVSELKNYLAKTGNTKEPYLAVVHRLDQPVEGLLVFGKNPEAAKKLSQNLQKGSLHKKYYALCFAKKKEIRCRVVTEEICEMAFSELML